MPSLLRWQNDWLEQSQAIFESYVSYIFSKYRDLETRLKDLAPISTRDIFRRLDMLSNDQLTHFLISPETSSRLLWPANYTDEEIINFMARASYAELCVLKPHQVDLSDHAKYSSEVLWTADGRAKVKNGIISKQTHQIRGFTNIDYSSPHARLLDQSGTKMRLETPQESPDDEFINVVNRRLTRIFEKIYDLDPEWATFFQLFTRVCVPQIDTEIPNSFSSGTSAQFVGRSVLSNPHLETVTDEIIAEALVHETIHGLLYMQEVQEPWVYSNDVYGSKLRTRSSWTGNPLPIRPFLQAAFVWYGLINFWGHALKFNKFDRSEIGNRLSIAVRGFLGKSLTGKVNVWQDDIAPELLQTVDILQVNVKEAFFV